MQNESLDDHTVSPIDTPTAGARSNDGTHGHKGSARAKHAYVSNDVSEFQHVETPIHASGAKYATVDLNFPIVEDNEEQSMVNDGVAGTSRAKEESARLGSGSAVVSQTANNKTMAQRGSEYQDSSMQGEE